MRQNKSAVRVPAAVAELLTARKGTESASSSWFGQFAKTLGAAAGIVAASGTLALGAAVVWGVYKELRREPVVVEAFQVPESLAKSGYTPEFAQGLFVAALFEIDERSRAESQHAWVLTGPPSRKAALTFAAVDPRNGIEIKVLGTAYSIHDIVEFIKRLRGHPDTELSGSINLLPGTDPARPLLTVAIDINGATGRRTVISPNHGLSEIESAIRDAALKTVKAVDPVIGANYELAQQEDQCAANLACDFRNLIGTFQAIRQLGNDRLRYEADLNLAYLYGKAKDRSEESLQEDALWYLEDAIDLDPSDVAGYSRRGLIYLRISNLDPKFLDKAHGEFRKVEKLLPSSSVAHTNIANVLYYKEQYADAMTEYALAEKLDKTNAENYYNWGRALADQGRFADAVEKFKMATRNDPAFYDAYEGAAFALLQLHLLDAADVQMLDAAEVQTRRAIELRPNDPRAHHTLGRIFAAHPTKGAQAIEEWQKAIASRVPREAAQALTSWAGYLRGYDQRVEAEKKFHEAIQADPTLPYAHHHLANLLVDECKYTEAMQELDEAIKLHTSGMVVDGIHVDHANLANAYADRGKLRLRLAQGAAAEGARQQQAAAEEDFKSAVKAEPDSAPALDYLGKLAAANGEWDKAIAKYKQADARGRAPNYVLTDWAKALLANNRIDEAARIIDRAWTESPRAPFVVDVLAQVRIRQGRPQEAIELYEAAIRDFPNETYLRKGRADVLATQFGRQLPTSEPATTPASAEWNPNCSTLPF